MVDEIHIPPTPEEIAVRLDRLERLTFDRSPEVGADEAEPTRSNIVKTNRNGDMTELEWNSIHSVEITQTVKEGWRVSKVKVYDADPLAAARLGAKLAMAAETEIVRALNAKHAAIRERADAADAEAEEPGQ